MCKINLNDHFTHFQTFPKISKTVVPNRWVATPKWIAEEFLWGGVFVGSGTAASIVCWSLEFLELRMWTFCYISKTETRTDLCEVHIISIIIPIWFILYSFNQPDCRMELCAEQVNPRRLRAHAFARQVREPLLLCMRGGKFFVRATTCGAKAHELNQLKNRKTLGCTKVVYQHCA